MHILPLLEVRAAGCQPTVEIGTQVPLGVILWPTYVLLSPRCEGICRFREVLLSRDVTNVPQNVGNCRYRQIIIKPPPNTHSVISRPHLGMAHTAVQTAGVGDAGGEQAAFKF